jgi:hypothetical protein
MRVAALLAASNFATLDPQYPLKWVDREGVSFEFDYRDGTTYRVDAPDDTQWPSGLAQLVGAFQQLVRDTPWTPPRDGTQTRREPNA